MTTIAAGKGAKSGGCAAASPPATRPAPPATAGRSPLDTSFGAAGGPAALHTAAATGASTHSPSGATGAARTTPPTLSTSGPELIRGAGAYIEVTQRTDGHYIVTLAANAAGKGPKIAIDLGGRGVANEAQVIAIREGLLLGTQPLFNTTRQGTSLNFNHDAVKDILFSPAPNSPRAALLEGLHFSKGSDLDGIQLAVGAEVKGCKFDRCLMRDSYLSHVKFIATKLIKCDAQSSNFSDSQFSKGCSCCGTDFRYSNLNHVDFGSTKLGGWFVKGANIVGTQNQGIKIDALERAKFYDKIPGLRYTYIFAPGRIINWSLRNVQFDKFEDPATQKIATKFSREGTPQKDSRLDDSKRGILSLVESEKLFLNVAEIKDPKTGKTVGHVVKREKGGGEYLYIGVDPDEDQKMQRAQGRVRLVERDSKVGWKPKAGKKTPQLPDGLMPAGAALYIAAEWSRGHDDFKGWAEFSQRANEAYSQSTSYL